MRTQLPGQNVQNISLNYGLLGTRIDRRAFEAYNYRARRKSYLGRTYLLRRDPPSQRLNVRSSFVLTNKTQPPCATSLSDSMTPLPTQTIKFDDPKNVHFVVWAQQTVHAELGLACMRV